MAPQRSVDEIRHCEQCKQKIDQVFARARKSRVLGNLVTVRCEATRWGRTQMNSKKGMGALVGALAMVGCGGEPLESDDLEIGSAEQDISGGLYVSEASNALTPFNSAVAIAMPAPGRVLCTALKVGSNRYLTAAHCLRDAPSSQFNIDIISDVYAGFQSNPFAVTAVYIHPSYSADPLAQIDNSPYSYDIALFDVSGNPPGVVAGAYDLNHVNTNRFGRFVGYGFDALADGNNNNRNKQTAAFYSTTRENYASATGENWAKSTARYAHEILAIESGIFREGTNTGDSGGPLFAWDSSTRLYHAMGVSSTGVNTDDDEDATFHSGFARIANVQNWLAHPHNFGLPREPGTSRFQDKTGFLQIRRRPGTGNPAGPCMRVYGTAVGTRATLAECEGYNPEIHSQMWHMQAVNSSYFVMRAGKTSVNRCLDISDNTTNVALYNCVSGRQKQQWYVVPKGPENGLVYYQVINRGTGLALTRSGSDSSGYDDLSVATPSSSQNQEWLFYL